VVPPQIGRGEGFTQTIIHEVGHEFGLMHPHQYGDMGDFIVSPMGYFTNDYDFGVIDKDAIQRAHADQLYLSTLNLVLSSSSSDLKNQVESKLTQMDAAYSQMNYAEAVQAALNAYHLALQTAGASGMSLIYLAAGAVIGLAIGVAAVMLLKRKRT